MFISQLLSSFLLLLVFQLLLLQLGTSFLAMFFGSFLGLDVTPCSTEYLKKFWPVACVFLGTIFCGLKAIQYSNIETFIIFRAATPIVLSFCDYMFLGRELPSCRSSFCLLTMLISSTAYVLTDSFFVIKGYFWIAIWYFVFVTDFVVIKHTVSKVQMTNWVRKCKFGVRSYPKHVDARPLIVKLDRLHVHVTQPSSHPYRHQSSKIRAVFIIRTDWRRFL